MTDRLSTNRFPTEPGHRYAPRQVGARREVEARISAAEATVAQSPQSTSSAAATSHTPGHQRRVSAAKPAHPRQNRSLVLKRRGLATPAVVKPVAAPVVEVTAPKRRHTRFHPANAHPALVFMGAAVLAAVLVFGGGVLLFRAKKQTPDKYTLGSAPATLGATTSQSNGTVDINEIPPTSSELAAYRTSGDTPRYLKIPKLQLNARVLTMDAGKDGLPAAPQNIYDAGWFARSAKPGASGVSLLNGQAVGNTKPGLFNTLESLAVNDVIQVERGDGKVITYKVAKIERYDPAKITSEVALAPAQDGKAGLNLLASNGRYNVKNNTFEKRLIVRTIQQ